MWLVITTPYCNSIILVVIHLQLLSTCMHVCLTHILYWLSIGTGTDTTEYITLRKNLSSIISSLRTGESKRDLYIKFIELDWLGPTVNPCESELVLLVLDRVRQNSRTFYEFVTLLNGISGMSATASDLITKVHERT